MVRVPCIARVLIFCVQPLNSLPNTSPTEAKQVRVHAWSACFFCLSRLFYVLASRQFASRRFSGTVITSRRLSSSTSPHPQLTLCFVPLCLSIRSSLSRCFSAPPSTDLETRCIVWHCCIGTELVCANLVRTRWSGHRKRTMPDIRARPSCLITWKPRSQCFASGGRLLHSCAFRNASRCKTLSALSNGLRHPVLDKRCFASCNLAENADPSL